MASFSLDLLSLVEDSSTAVGMLQKVALQKVCSTVVVLLLSCSHREQIYIKHVLKRVQPGEPPLCSPSVPRPLASMYFQTHDQTGMISVGARAHELRQLKMHFAAGVIAPDPNTAPALRTDPVTPPLVVKQEVKALLRKQNVRKAAGSDGVSAFTLKGDVLYHQV